MKEVKNVGQMHPLFIEIKVLTPNNVLESMHGYSFSIGGWDLPKTKERVERSLKRIYEEKLISELDNFFKRAAKAYVEKEKHGT